MHHAHLAHALEQTSRAIACYSIAAALAEHDSFVRLSARAGETVLLLSLQSEEEEEECVDGTSPEPRVDRKEALAVAKTCRGMGGTLEAIGQIIEALASLEILRSKCAALSLV